MHNCLLIVLVLFIVFLNCCSTRKITLKTIQREQKIEDTHEIIKRLASDSFLGREPGTKAYELTVSYVDSVLKTHNIKPYFENSYRDTLTVEGKESYNIVALIGAKDKDKKHILIGAHLDDIGKSKNDIDSIYNGANDNASGSTAVLQIAKELNKYNFKQNIIIALFTGEESGLIGSSHLAKRLKSEGINLSYMLNFEMLGKTLSLGKNKVYITGFNKSNCAEKINDIMNKSFITFSQAEIMYSLFYRSDNAPFYYGFNVPCHTISSFDFKNYEHYHKESDEFEQLDLENMHALINSSTFFISQLLLEETEIKLYKVDK